MLQVTSFTFNPFSENMYVVSNEHKECIIFDPGMYDAHDEQELDNFIKRAGLQPRYLINTHCHIDHILGNTYCAEKYGLELLTHRMELGVLEMGKASAALYGLHYNESVSPAAFIDEHQTINLGDDELSILFTPGHSPGSLSFYSSRDRFLISGDVLFQNSIGRSDLPGGNFETLLHSIHTRLLTLPDDTVVYSGHGPATSIGAERRQNPFLSAG